MNILMPALYGLHCILGPPDVIPNISLVDTLAENAGIDIWSMVPSLVDELGESSDVLDKFRSSKFICASGGKHTHSFGGIGDHSDKLQAPSALSVPAR
jgi:hypothetical protein